MRLREALKEGVIASTPYVDKRKKDFNDYAELIEKNCSQALRELKKAKGFLWRGTMSGGRDKEFMERSWKAGMRPTMHTPKPAHIFMNKKFKEEFGWNVRNGISATGDSMQSHVYGVGYMFFPFDKYKFVYNPDVRDVIFKVPNWDSGRGETKDQYIAKIWDPLTELIKGYTDRDLPKAIESDVEIMFKTKKYYLLHNTYVSMADRRWIK